MKKFAKIAMAASVLMMPFSANALPTNGTYSGTVGVTKGISLTCNLNVTVSGITLLNPADPVNDVPAKYTANASLALTSGLLCPLVTFHNQPNDAEFTVSLEDSATGTYAINGIEVTAITPGGCQGDANGAWSENATHIYLDVAAVLPPQSGGTGNCSIEGTVSKAK